MTHRNLFFALLLVTGGLLILSPAPGKLAFADPLTPGLEEQEPTPAPTSTGILDELVPTRTPEPTGTPDAISEQLDNLTQEVGLEVSVLGLRGADWLNLGVSILFVVAGYLLGTLLIRRLLPRLVRRTTSRFDDEFLQAIGNDVRWLVVVLTLHFATRRLVFLNADLKLILNDVYYVAGLILVMRIIFKLIQLANEWALKHYGQQERDSGLEPLIVLFTRVGQVLAVILGVTVLLSHFGVNITGVATLLGFTGLAISLAARDTIADAIAGFIVLVDRPYRIGDRIEIQGLGTWGDVIDIGLRTTRIRTRDNRLVIVPNSAISTNQVVNYTYPDPQYRIQTHVGIGYGSDIEKVRQILVNTVREVEGVLPDKPVDALYIEMGDSAMVFRVRWWIESYKDTRLMFDEVHTALQNALDEAQIECPYPTQNLNVHVESQEPENLLSAPGDKGPASGESGA